MLFIKVKLTYRPEVEVTEVKPRVDSTVVVMARASHWERNING